MEFKEPAKGSKQQVQRDQIAHSENEDLVNQEVISSELIRERNRLLQQRLKVLCVQSTINLRTCFAKWYDHSIAEYNSQAFLVSRGTVPALVASTQTLNTNSSMSQGSTEQQMAPAPSLSRGSHTKVLKLMSPRRSNRSKRL